MKSFTSSVIAVASFLALVSAAPSQKTRNVPYVDVTFHGATPEAVYTLPVPLDGYTEVYTHNSLSISSVEYDLSGVECCLYGTDSNKAAAAMPRIANWGQVGPPQTILSITCNFV